MNRSYNVVKDQKCNPLRFQNNILNNHAGLRCISPVSSCCVFVPLHSCGLFDPLTYVSIGMNIPSSDKLHSLFTRPITYGLAGVY